MKRLLLIDGNAIMHRAYHALPPFKTKAGLPTNVIYGFFGMIHKAVQLLEPTHMVVCFDTPAPTFRQELLPSYQAQRPKIDDSFIRQIPILKELIEAARIHQSEKDGLEADDIIGTLAHNAHKHKMKTFILTGDKDIMQLVNDMTFVVSPQTGLSNVKVYGEKEVEERLGVPPAQIPELKALMGDPSDNYKGAKGIGPKTAIKLIGKYGTMDNLLKKCDEIDEESKKDVALSYKIATIVTDADIPNNIVSMTFDGFPPSFREKLLSLEMYSLASRIFNNKGDKKSPPPAQKPVSKTKEYAKDQIGLF